MIDFRIGSNRSLGIKMGKLGVPESQLTSARDKPCAFVWVPFPVQTPIICILVSQKAPPAAEADPSLTTETEGPESRFGSRATW